MTLTENGPFSDGIKKIEIKKIKSTVYKYLLSRYTSSEFERTTSFATLNRGGLVGNRCDERGGGDALAAF
jgi:hypothetical protein